jgi:hypothetical protein
MHKQDCYDLDSYRRIRDLLEINGNVRIIPRLLEMGKP